MSLRIQRAKRWTQIPWRDQFAPLALDFAWVHVGRKPKQQKPGAQRQQKKDKQ
jgi:hypothetical protein